MRLRVSVEPWRMTDGCLEMRFEIEGRQHHRWTHVVDQDDLDSTWDLMWHSAEKLLREAIRAEKVDTSTPAER